MKFLEGFEKTAVSSDWVLSKVMSGVGERLSRTMGQSKSKGRAAAKYLMGPYQKETMELANRVPWHEKRSITSIHDASKPTKEYYLKSLQLIKKRLPKVKK